MPREDWEKDSVYRRLTSVGLWPNREIRSVLDLGCGLSLKSRFIPAERRVGVDAWWPYLERARQEDKDAVLVHADVMRCFWMFAPASFSVVLLSDILEHFEREQGFYLLRQAERLARVAVVVESPEGDMPQNLDITGHGAHELQTHRSAWSRVDLIDYGFKVVPWPYKLSPIKRHTDKDVPLDITMLTAIKVLG